MSKRQDEPLLNGPVRRWIANRQRPRYTVVNVCPEVAAMFLTFPLSYPLFVVDWQRQKIIGSKGFTELVRETKEMWDYEFHNQG
jgi:hypothetical protein